MALRSINKKIKSLFYEVIMPYYKKRKEDIRIKHLLKNNKVVRKFNYNFAKIAVLMARGYYEEAFKLLDEMYREYKDDKTIDKDLIKEYLEFFLKLLTHWMKKHYPDVNIDDYFEAKNNLREIFKEIFEKEVDDSEELDFFDFDSFETEERENIDSMHYKDHQKVSASEFMQSATLDEDTVDELKDLSNEIEHAKYLEFSDEYLEEVRKILYYFIQIFEVNYEFSDLGYALRVLYEKIENIEVSDDKKEIFKAYLDSILDDLEKWADQVIFEQSAKDIHYLDASLLANIAQIDILFATDSNNEDELELF